MSKKCTGCKIQNTETKKISLVTAECEATRQHAIIKHLIGVVLALVLLLFGSNLAWIVYESQFDTVYETYEVEQDTEHGNNNCIIKGGEICNGISEN